MCDYQAADNRDLLGSLRGALDALRAAGRLPLSGAVADVELTQAMQLLEAITRVCAGQKSTLIGEITGREAHRGQAAGSTADLLARTLHLTRRCSGLRRNRPAALQGTRLRAGRVGTLSSP